MKKIPKLKIDESKTTSASVTSPGLRSIKIVFIDSEYVSMYHQSTSTLLVTSRKYYLEKMDQLLASKGA